MKQSMTYHFSLEDLEKLVQQEQIRVVSFDLFDTLLVRPSMKPTDIFYLLQSRVQKEYGLDFVALRLHAEQQMQNEYATLEQIWQWIGKQHHLVPEITHALMDMELELEARLLTVRTDMLTLLEKAKSAGKRVIVTSDMYIGSEDLMRILREKGIAGVERVYVSCECRARKSEGRLFEQVVRQEGLASPSQMVHIGDNIVSDCQAALEQGVTAAYYPSIWADAFGPGRPWNGIMGEEITQDPYCRLLLSYAVFYTYLERNRRMGEERCFVDAGDIASLYLGNILLAISLDLLDQPAIRGQYDRVAFAARDGYLPKRIYDILAEGEGALPSLYLEASRQALSYTTYQDFFDYFDHVKWESVFQKYRLEDYIHLILVDQSLAEGLIAGMTQSERNLDLSFQLQEARRVLVRFKKRLNQYFDAQRELAKAYYQAQFPGEGKRYLVFDCGYSGSVSLGLAGACPDTRPVFDKYYVWEKDENRARDEEHGTKTFCLSQSDDFGGINFILEECFSPMSGSCLGFARDGERIVGVHDPMTPDESMVQTLGEMHAICEDYARRFKALFGPYMESFSLTDRDVITSIGRTALLKSPYMEVSLLKPIRFTDSVNGGVPMELSKKIYDSFEMLGKYPTVFHQTQYLNPDCVAVPVRNTQSRLRIGIHLHIHYLHVLEECICYLRDFPTTFDLIVTTTRPQSMAAIERLCRAFLPGLKKLEVIAVENRGRDVAPWLAATKPFQKDYDLFCHLHGKASVEHEDGVGTQWRRYLFDNLIARNAAADIINLFEDDPELGCVFPEYFSYIRRLCVSNHIPLIGEDGEQKIIEELMREMHMDRFFSRDDMLCSAGTMLWYRPEALRPLFELNLTAERFPEEPIAVGGTLAHAIERMPGLVCASQGYRAMLFNERTEQGATAEGDSGALAGSAAVRAAGKRGQSRPEDRSLLWYIKKAIKFALPYGAIRVWQKVRYKF